MEEQWRDYEPFKGIYQISSLSRIRNIQTGRILKKHLHHSNYYTISFRKPGQKPKYLSVARLVAIVWIPNPENKKEVNHINGVTTDDRIGNLEWATPSENIMHYYYKLDKGAKRKVDQFNMDGSYVATYDSIRNAVKEVKKINPKATDGNIVLCCQGKNHYAYNFKWKYNGERGKKTYSGK